MKTEQEIKNMVKEKYSSIAKQSSGCCSSESSCGCGFDDVYSIQESYTNLQGYVESADLGLGCGLPTQFANIKEGDTVVDLGSGAGNDVFVARHIVGSTGKVIGIDMTETMIDKAKANNKKLGFTNVEFHLGEIENLPLESHTANVVISNCVLNLVPNKEKAFQEIFRVLKPGAHFCISDIVLQGILPESLQKSAEAYTGCISGALQESEYLKAISDAGFKEITIQKKKSIDIPKDLLAQLGVLDEADHFYQQNGGIFSITVTGIK